MVLVTHNPGLARRCARIHLLEDGILKAFNDIGSEAGLPSPEA
jgi:ABC-type lipoprotein export system ATPase subunit